MLKIISDDNVDASSLSILESRGFRVRRELNAENGIEYDIAESDSGEFWGISPVEVLGLIQVHRERGDSWQPNKQEVRRFNDYDEVRETEIRKEILKETVSEVTKPKNLINFAAGVVVSGLRVFLVIGFAAVYFNYHLNAASVVSWITLPLGIIGIWKFFEVIEKTVDFYISKVSEPPL